MDLNFAPDGAWPVEGTGDPNKYKRTLGVSVSNA